MRCYYKRYIHWSFRPFFSFFLFFLIGFSWGLLRVMFLVLMLAHRTVKLFSLTSCSCPFRRGRGQKKKKKNQISWRWEKCGLASSDSDARVGVESESSTRGIASHAAHGQGGNCRAAFFPQRWIWFQGCGSETGKRSPLPRDFLLGSSSRFTCLRAFQSATSFPRRWTEVSRELLSEGGGSLRRPHQHPSPALLQ